MKKLICVLLCTLLLSSCSLQKYEKTMFSLDTQIDMTAYGNGADKALLLAEEEIKRIDEKFKISNISKTAWENDEETQNLLKTAEEIKNKTNGAFNVAVAPIVEAWGFYSEEFTQKQYRVPDKNEIDSALEKMHQGNDIDLGAIAKGYCADRVVKILKEQGVTSAVLSLGGNVAAIGNNPNGKPWKVGIKSPFDNEIYATVSVSDMCVVTSGDYVRCFYENGKKYHHIIDTKTGYPADSGLSSVTVICKNSTVADALSTALFVMGKDKACKFLAEHKNFSMILIENTGKLWYTDDIEIETSKECEKIEVTNGD